jgi:hypothetical protein
VKRLLVFLVVGPLIFNAMGLLLFGDPERGIEWLVTPLVSIPFALLIGAIDYGLKDYRLQPAYVGLAGYLLAAIMLHSWSGGITGCATATICSWLAHQSWSPREA